MAGGETTRCPARDLVMTALCLLVDSAMIAASLILEYLAFCACSNKMTSLDLASPVIRCLDARCIAIDDSYSGESCWMMTGLFRGFCSVKTCFCFCSLRPFGGSGAIVHFAWWFGPLPSSLLEQ